jgi:hypothetical protein
MAVSAVGLEPESPNELSDSLEQKATNLGCVQASGSSCSTCGAVAVAGAIDPVDHAGSPYRLTVPRDLDHSLSCRSIRGSMR